MDKNPNDIDDNDLIDDIHHRDILSKQIELDKLVLTNLIIKDGDAITKNIEKKKKLQEIEKRKLIKKILRLEKKIYTKDELESYAIVDLRDILERLNEEKKSYIMHILSFFR